MQKTNGDSKGLVLSLFVSTVFCAGTAFGAAWNYSGSGSWDVAGNWLEGSVPTSGTCVTNNVGTMTIAEGVDAVCRRFFLGTASGKSGTLVMTGGTLTLAEVGQNSQVAAKAGASGSIEMSGGVMIAEQLQVGAYGTGTMTLTGGIVSNRNWSCIGRYAGGVGSMTISGTGLWVNTAAGSSGNNTVFVGEQGVGTLTIENGGELRFEVGNKSGVVLGNNAAGTGTLYLKPGGLITAPYVRSGSTTSTFVLDGGTLRKHTSAATETFIQGVGTFKVGPNGGTIDTLDQRQGVTLDIDDFSSTAGAIVKMGSGELALGGWGHFSGGFDVKEGTLSAPAAVNLPGYATAPITVRAGATLSLGGAWRTSEVAALTNRADFVLEEGATLAYGGEISTSDVVINVGGGVTRTISGYNLPGRFVKMGAGTLVVEGANTFAGGVVVSNGVLKADQAANLGNAHVTVSGGGANDPAYFMPAGASSLTTPLATSGAGTINFLGYGGVKSDRPLTVNFGGAGEVVKFNNGGFSPIDFAVQTDGGEVTLVNGLDNNGVNRTLRKYGSNRLVMEGGITNSSSSAGEFFFWDNGVVLPARPNGWAHGYWHLCPRGGTTVFSNAVLRSTSDLIVGGAGAVSQGAPRLQLVNCDKISTGGWDYINGKTGTVLVVDGGSYKQNSTSSRFMIGTSIGFVGDLTMTNNPTVQIGQLFHADGTVRQYSGTFKVGSGEQQIGSHSNTASAVKMATWLMKGGKIYMQDGVNFQIGARGHGHLIQTGGEISASTYPCIGRYPKSQGRYDLHGGHFVHRDLANGGSGRLLFIAEEGTGTVSVANGGWLTVTNVNGVCISSKAKSYGHLILSPGGTAEVVRVYGQTATDRDNGVTFNGGTYKALTAGQAGGFINTSVQRITATALGGVVDTAGKGDFTIPKAITAATRADDLSEALAHRWSFRNGSLADLVGTSTATLVGSAVFTNDTVTFAGTANGTSSINLGTNVLPSDGRDATVEMWFTPLRHVNWARVFNFGFGQNAEAWLSFNRGSANTTMQFTVSGLTTVYSTIKMEMGRTYYLAFRVEKDPDSGLRWVTVNIFDPVTGARLDRLQMSSATWSIGGNVKQSNGTWIGRSSAAADNDAACVYHDVRVYHRALTDGQMAANAVKGADEIFYFTKAGGGSLTLTGANTYRCGTAVAGGTLRLASGATLPATEIRVDAGATLQLNAADYTASRLAGTGTVAGGRLAVTGEIHPGEKGSVGTLTLSGTELTGGTLVADVGANGAADKLVASGTLDLSALDFRLGDLTALDTEKRYTLVEAGEVRGTFATVGELPRRWSLAVAPTRVRLVYGEGSVFFVR